ncbi:hypothetical protein NBRC3257_0639 [Gluconobacter thailandicus NBRC 3257]|uniref:Uncharacterized protein n=1 Tax=Gluconobacter thailandicus NBRC 3257 TaxID=1381097 RepID=A0ABQ0ITV8_GLUTH|nr:hypothetical protein NBRC3255_2597 [Gluconobacter thailandicus NBRC 3255]GAD25640.1 hypothetical protein NBRC3257_0639 [Gluconobacter thailandicus NBRC 3257]
MRIADAHDIRTPPEQPSGDYQIAIKNSGITVIKTCIPLNGIA